MRRIIVLAVAGLVALAIAGVAVAHLKSAGVSAATATFSAGKDRANTRTCTGDGDTYEITRGWYAGTVDFADPHGDLDGPIRFHVVSVLNKTDGVGWIEGTFRVRDDDRRAHGKFWGTLSADGSLDGFVNGRVNRSYARLLGSMSATFNAGTGFANGKIGNGATSLPAVLIGRPCKNTKPAPIAVRLIVKGEVTFVDATTIKVKPRDGSSEQSCALKAGVSPVTSGISVGTDVEIRCGLVDGVMTLLKLHTR